METAANSCANSTNASRATATSAHSPRAKPLPHRRQLQQMLEFFPVPGSTQISTCGLATRRTSPHGNCCGTPDKRTRPALMRRLKVEPRHPPKPHFKQHLNL